MSSPTLLPRCFLSCALLCLVPLWADISESRFEDRGLDSEKVDSETLSPRALQSADSAKSSLSESASDATSESRGESALATPKASLETHTEISTGTDTGISAETDTETGVPSTKPFLVLLPHKAFYIMPAYYSFSPIGEGKKRTETKFQLSFKLGMRGALFSPYGRLYFAYTQSAWFQNYNREDSRPFRDIDYQPELLYSFERDLPLFGGAIRELSLSLVHTSNGERWARSRTQNRLKASMRWERDLSYNQARSKVGLESSLWAYVGTGSEHFLHDNPDLARYAGYGELRAYYKSQRQLVEVYARPSRYPLFVLGYTWRVSENIGLYCQYTNGFGDSMYEYKTHSNRLGVGFRLWD